MKNSTAHRRTSRPHISDRCAHPLSPLSSSLSPRAAFTLVELLVATALVLLIMVMMAQVFGVALGTINSQTAIAHNDQKARMLTAQVRNDLQEMTYRQPLSGDVRGIVPLSPGDPVDALQRGFFYYSENDVGDDTDDVLHLTVDLSQTLGDPTVSSPRGPRFTGHAAPLGEDLNCNGILDTNPPEDTNNNGVLDLFPNQPDWDDGQCNGVGISRAAEVSYFLRGRILYRRVQLLRDPAASATPPYDTQPTRGVTGNGGPVPAFQGPYPSGSFYNDFDYSATRVWAVDGNTDGVADPESTASPPPPTADLYRLHFHGLESLDNSVGTTNFPLAIPQNRYGFHFIDNRPREYLLSAAGLPRVNPTTGVPYFIGRFTDEETSAQSALAAFLWPGFEQVPTSHVMRRRDLVLSPANVVGVDSNGNGLWDNGEPLYSGPRAGEDILLTNVDAFDVKVWDNGYNEDLNGNGMLDNGEDSNGNGVLDAGLWVDLGNNFGLGYYSSARNRNPYYGPLPVPDFNSTVPVYRNRVYDTWHPSAGADFNNDNVLAPVEVRPPYRPRWTDTVPGATNVTWAPNTAYSGSAFFFPDRLGADNAPGRAGVDDDQNGVTDFNAGVPDPGEIGWPGTDDGTNSIAYRILVPGTSGFQFPEWPRQSGAIVVDGSVVWQAFDNRVGLEKIQIIIRYRDVTTGASRQVTIVHSFVE